MRALVSVRAIRRRAGSRQQHCHWRRRRLFEGANANHCKRLSLLGHVMSVRATRVIRIIRPPQRVASACSAVGAVAAAAACGRLKSESEFRPKSSRSAQLSRVRRRLLRGGRLKWTCVAAAFNYSVGWPLSTKMLPPSPPEMSNCYAACGA